MPIFVSNGGIAMQTLNVRQACVERLQAGPVPGLDELPRLEQHALA